MERCEKHPELCPERFISSLIVGFHALSAELELGAC